MQYVIVFLSLVSLACGYHILCVQDIPSNSHYNLMKGIVRPLLEAGHQVTMITTFPEDKPTKNLKFIDVSHVLKLVPKLNMLDPSSQTMAFTISFSRNISVLTLETPAVRDALINQNFDAVVSEWFFSDFNAGYAAVQQAPWIFLSGVVMHNFVEHIIDMVRSVPTHPTLTNDFPVPMSFWQRLSNTGSYLFMTGLKLLDQPTNKAIYDSQFKSIASARGVELPPFSEALYNVSILFVNSHPSFAPAMSLPPNVVDIAGYHIDENVPPLPKDLQDLLDSSSNGVVYFSMGSVLKSAELPEKTKKSIIKTFSDLPYTVLWKFEEKIEGLPKNVHVRPWMPQSSILSHPNVKVFITHGGLLSTLESLHYGIPIIAVPVFGDQPGNAKRSVREGRALIVDLKHIGEELGKALKEMLGNDSYYNRAKFLSKLFRNRPVKPGKLIQHYIELAIESKELNMLDPSSQTMAFTISFSRNISVLTLETPAVRDALINQNFDAVVSEWFFSDFNAGYAAVQQAPWIFLSGVVMHNFVEHIIDMVRSVPTHPTLTNDFPVPMSFWQRLSNTGSYLFMTGLKLLDQPTNKAIYDSQFKSIASARGVELPPFSEALYNVSILFVNSHPSFAPAMSLPPNVVDIAGYHIDENVPPLPKDLQDLLDSSSNGVVYFSMGSVLKSAELPEKTKKSIIKTFSDLPYTVLWKFEEKIEGLPKNVHVRPWMPQSSILSHPNVKVFITHGGLLSTLESLHYGIPIIAVPVFGDQPGNAKRSVREGRALIVDLKHIGEELGKALKEMLGNDSYYNRAKFLSKLFRNRPVKPGKLIQHYIELAIESKGAYHLRSKTHDYAWYELWMLDQLAFVLVVVYSIIKFLKMTVRLITRKEKQRKEKKH